MNRFTASKHCYSAAQSLLIGLIDFCVPMTERLEREHVNVSVGKQASKPFKVGVAQVC